MRTTVILSVVIPAAIVAGLVVSNCTGQMGTNPSNDPYEDLFDQDWLVGCDPDSLTCPEDYFICVPDGVGGKDCRGGTLPGGDGEGWSCQPEGNTLQCWGDSMPEGEGWECVETEDGEYECERTFFGEGGADGYWRCEEDGEFTICVFVEGTDGGGDGDGDSDGDGDGDVFPETGIDQCPPGIEVPTEEMCHDRIDNDCDGDIDEDCDEEDCLCVPGAQRYCDWDPTYCGWGVQTCLEDGLEWGPCLEAEPPLACAGLGPIYSRAGQDCCVEQGFCCQDFHDSDRDNDVWESLGDCTDIVCGF